MTARILVFYTAKARKGLKKLEQKTNKRIVKKVHELAHSQNPLRNAKALTGSLSGKYRYRIGEYRVVFSIDGKGNITILTILVIKHRKDVYKLLD